MKYLILLSALLFSTIGNAQRVSIYYADGTPKTSAAIQYEEARIKANIVNAPVVGSSNYAGGTSHAFRKEVREVKADIKKATSDGKKKLKGYDFVGPYISYPNSALGIRPVQKGGKWGFIEVNDYIVKDLLPLEYDDYRVAPTLVLAVKKGAKWGFIDDDGQTLLPFEYDQVIAGFNDPLSPHKGTAVVVVGGRQFEIDGNGTDIGAKTIVATDQIIVTDKTGTQYWMTVNLNVNSFRNGDLIPEAKTKEEWDNAAAAGTPCWSFNDNDASNGITFGRLYNWYAVNDPRGLAPAGFHVPDENEWLALFKTHGGLNGAFNGLRSEQGWRTRGSNSFGFSALPGGAKYSSFTRPVDTAVWWTSVSTDNNNAVAYDIRTLYPVERASVSKGYGMSVRCLKD